MNNKTEMAERASNNCIKAYIVDAYANGITFGESKKITADNFFDSFPLSINEGYYATDMRSRYSINKKDSFDDLETRLMRLSWEGNLYRSIVILGFNSDPFLPFENKFHASLKFLELLSKYNPGLLVLQTRSPLIVLAMPVLKKIKKNLLINIGIETNLEHLIRRYTPHLPRFIDRIKVARTLRNFDLKTTIQVSPVLPYGDWKTDANNFAEQLCQSADYISIKSITDGSETTERKVRNMQVAKLLAQDRKFHWLRPDAATPLIACINNIAPEKLDSPKHEIFIEKQLSIFAA